MSGRVLGQKSPVVWNASAAMTASASVSSASFTCDGYARVTGMLVSSASSESNGLKIWQSGDRGQNYDYITAYSVSACSGSAFSIELVGNAVKIEYHTDSAADEFRTNWQVRPI